MLGAAIKKVGYDIAPERQEFLVEGLHGEANAERLKAVLEAVATIVADTIVSQSVPCNIIAVETEGAASSFRRQDRMSGITAFRASILACRCSAILTVAAKAGVPTTLNARTQLGKQEPGARRGSHWSRVRSASFR